MNVLVGSGDDRSPRDPYHILSDIHSILDDSAKKGPAEHPVSTLSSVDRDTWTAARKELIRLGNTDALAEIDDAMFCLSLDNFSGIYNVVCLFITHDKHMNPQMLMSPSFRVSIGDNWNKFSLTILWSTLGDIDFKFDCYVIQFEIIQTHHYLLNFQLIIYESIHFP